MGGDSRDQIDMDNPIDAFGKTATGLSRNPLGIIALFIVLVYGFAALVTAFPGSLQAADRTPLVYFLVTFPVVVLAVFAWLVSQHANKLYGPSDYKDENNFVTVVASLAAASARQESGRTDNPPIDLEDIRKIVARAHNVAQEARVSLAQPLGPASPSILWVDDRPQNNAYERKAFEAVGISCTLALSTDEALRTLNHTAFSAIISDMGRVEGPREGYALLDAVRGRGIKTPYFIYAGSNAPEHTKEALAHGAQGNTNNPQVLFRMVVDAIYS